MKKNCRSLYFRVMKFLQNRIWHYFMKWWIRYQSLEWIYHSLFKPKVGFSLILCQFRLSWKKVNSSFVQAYKYQYMKMMLLISVLLTFPIIDSFLKMPLDGQIYVENQLGQGEDWIFFYWWLHAHPFIS